MATTRRDFLKLIGVGATGSACLGSEGGGSANGSYEDRWGMLIDLSVCIGCRKCEFACKQTQQFPSEPIEAYEDKSVFERQRRIDAEDVTFVNRHGVEGGEPKPVYVKNQCMHCNRPACASACPVGAIRKTAQGPVMYSERTCIGCRYCMMACPFTMLAYTYDDPLTPVVRKCTLCFETVSREGGVPACAKICPVEAITFGTRGKLLTLAHDKIRKNPEKYVNHVYGEREVGGTSVLYISPKPFEQVGFRTDLGTAAVPERSERFMSVIPFVVSIWPAMLVGAYKLSQRGRAGSPHAGEHHEPGGCGAGACAEQKPTEPKGA